MYFPKLVTIKYKFEGHIYKSTYVHDVPDINRSIKDIKCGIHSGFPICCISFYSFLWRPVLIRYPLLRSWHDALERDKGPGYIRCPLCMLRRHIVDVKECVCHMSNS